MGCHGKRINVTADGCHSNGMSKQSGVTARGCGSKWDVEAKGKGTSCHGKGVSKQRDVTARGCLGHGMSCDEQFSREAAMRWDLFFVSF